MPESPTHSHPPPPKESVNSNSPNPNPNPDSSEQDPSQKSQPSTPENQNPPSETPFDESQLSPHQEIHQDDHALHILVDDLEQEREEEQEEEGMNMTMSSPTNASVKGSTNYASKNAVSSVRRNTKRRKYNWRKGHLAATQKKMQALSAVFQPIPFVPGKVLDFSKHEENLKKLGLWDFAHVEFDRNIKADLIMQLIVNYSTKVRGSYVNDLKIGVNRADLGRALNLPVKKPGGESDGESYSAQFISFLEEFVSNWMLLHGDMFCTSSSEVVNWMKLIKDGQPQKVDWAGLIWYMVEKELAQGPKLKECYYASHLQQLIKVQKEELLDTKVGVENQKVEVLLEDDKDGGDAKMLDFDESSSGGQKSEEQTVGLGLAPDFAQVEDVRDRSVVEKDGDAGTVERDGDAGTVERDGDADTVEGDGDADTVEREGDSDTVERDGDAHIAGKDGDDVMAEKAGDPDMDVKDGDDVMADKDGEADKDDEADNVEMDGDTENAEMVDDVGKGNKEDSVDHNWSVDETHNVENIENADNVEHTKEEKEDRDVDMMNFGVCRGEEQGHWLFDGGSRADGGQHFLQRCNMADANVSIEDRRTDGDREDVENEEVEEDGQVEGFKIMQKCPLDGMTSANLMQAFETGNLAYTSPELGGQSSLELMSSRAENNMMLGGPSMFNVAGKREIDHEHDNSHHSLDGSHKRMRLDGAWDDKTPDMELCMEQMFQWAEKAKMAHEAAKQEAYQQANMTAQIYAHQLSAKDSEILQLRCKLEELQRRKQADISRRDKELYLLSSVVDGYRRALKDTQRAFAEYRKRCQVADEPIYRDAGSGGVVKSIMELERERIKQEEEERMMRYVIEDTFTKHLSDYELKWEELLGKVLSLDSRLKDAANEAKLLKVELLKRKTSTDVQLEEQGPQE